MQGWEILCSQHQISNENRQLRYEFYSSVFLIVSLSLETRLLTLGKKFKNEITMERSPKLRRWSYFGQGWDLLVIRVN